MIDDVLPYAALAFIAAIMVMFAMGIRRGRDVQATNEKIEENQRRSIEMSQRQIDLAERNVTAMERIASALERRGA